MPRRPRAETPDPEVTDAPPAQLFDGEGSDREKHAGAYSMAQGEVVCGILTADWVSFRMVLPPGELRQRFNVIFREACRFNAKARRSLSKQPTDADAGLRIVGKLREEFERIEADEEDADKREALKDNAFRRCLDPAVLLDGLMAGMQRGDMNALKLAAQLRGLLQETAPVVVAPVFNIEIVDAPDGDEIRQRFGVKMVPVVEAIGAS